MDKLSPRAQPVGWQLLPFANTHGLQDFNPKTLAKNENSRFEFSMKYDESIPYDLVSRRIFSIAAI